MKGEYSIRMLCELLGVSPSGYYDWCAGQPSMRQREDTAMAAEIALAHRASRGSYGAPRIVEDLRDVGIRTSKRRCARLMRAHGLRGRKKHRRKPRTTDSRHRRPIALNLLAERPAPTGPNQSWATDFMPFPGLCRVGMAAPSDEPIADAA
jgi:putative transposase